MNLHIRKDTLLSCQPAGTRNPCPNARPLVRPVMMLSNWLGPFVVMFHGRQHTLTDLDVILGSDSGNLVATLHGSGSGCLGAGVVGLLGGSASRSLVLLNDHIMSDVDTRECGNTRDAGRSGGTGHPLKTSIDMLVHGGIDWHSRKRSGPATNRRGVRAEARTTIDSC